ncbi:hypothetical protein [Rhizobium wuzhouense]|uniref:DUF2384 domain-containing protein n=1 Tax=Rhizobium wuzhouense TaxID=1986026 RepID=A0ABX5NTS9_9HYPH|nr:hypothetical protein [Rhizobium wuzhouense]PYB73919.1 hypothetical protein DMY87_09340 [Rhizobium wuzhouense]
MTTSGKKIRIPQPVLQVSVDAALLPKSPVKPAGASAAPGSDGKARINIVAPIAPKAVALRQNLRQQSVKAAVARVDAAIEANTVSPTEAKALVLALAEKIVGPGAAAEKWYRSHHLAAFGGRTPAQMVRAGELPALVAHMKGDAAKPKG